MNIKEVYILGSNNGEMVYTEIIYKYFPVYTSLNKKDGVVGG